MSQPNMFRITAKDYATIQELLEMIEERDQVFAPLIRRRLIEASIVFGDDIEADRATLDSRLVFRVNDGPPYVRTLVARSNGRDRNAVLPLLSFRGLVLLGLQVGGSTHADPLVGQRETVFLDAVLFQPEAHIKENGRQTAASAPG